MAGEAGVRVPVGFEETKACQQVSWRLVAKGRIADARQAHVEDSLHTQQPKCSFPRRDLLHFQKQSILQCYKRVQKT